MNIRLSLASLLIRGRMQMPWLRTIDRAVTEALASLLDDEGTSPILSMEMPGDPSRFRSAMSCKHALLVEELLAQRGEEGTRLGREAMHQAGVRLGREVRNRLRLSDDRNELMVAARLLYRVLGIDFSTVDEGRSMKVSRCSLAENYTPVTCEVISAMDEGVVSGLNPYVDMRFVRRNCRDPPMCRAELEWRARK
jgi:hypothetical protein